MKSLFTTVLPFILMVFFFQNCADEQLALKSLIEDKKKEISSLNLKAHVCSDISFLDQGNTNFVFVIDMTRSNIGDFRVEKQNVGGQSFDVYYFDPSQARDPDHARFDAITRFIETCASNPSNRFAVIGFGETAGALTYNSLGRPVVNCSVPPKFYDATTALQLVDEFAQASRSEEAHYGQWVTRPYDEPRDQQTSNFSWTSYSDGADCTRRMIRDDLRNGIGLQASRYEVFFLSDGLANEGPLSISDCRERHSGDLEARTNCLVKNATTPFSSTYIELSALNINMGLNAIGYGLKSEDEYFYLDEMAALFSDRPSLRLDAFRSQENLLCDLYSTSLGLEKTPLTLMSTVLTLNRRNGILVPDSDMDGIPDDEELKLGYDPHNPRSVVDGVLDGICEIMGGPTECMELNSRIDCTPDQIYSHGLSDCDVKMFQEKYPHLNLGNEADWDDDGVSNFIEIVKGTNPLLYDMDLDPDNDGFTTRYEIIRSMNPYQKHPLELDPENQVVVRTAKRTENNSCPLIEQNIVVDHIPVVATKAVSFNHRSDILHGTNEHVVAFFSKFQTRNWLNESQGMSGKFVRIIPHKDDDGETIYVPELTEVKNEDFEKWEP